jgi:hypothetical protein
MSQAITITSEDILHQVKLSCKIPSVIEEIVTRKIIADAAAEAGIKVETEELQKAADSIRIMGKLKSADDTWAWLQKHGLSLDDFEEVIYNNVISGKLAQHLFADKVEPFLWNISWIMLGLLCMKLSWMMKTWQWNSSMGFRKER